MPALSHVSILPANYDLVCLPVNYDLVCWDDACAGGDLEHVRLQVCVGCRVARYCSVQCQERDWSRHKGQCTQAKTLYAMSRCGIQPCDRMRIEERQFSAHTLGLLSSDSGVLSSEPRWRFMRLSSQLDILARYRLHRLTRAAWLDQLAHENVATALDWVWSVVYMGDAPGVAMIPSVDGSGERIVVRDHVRSLSRRAAVQCVLKLVEFGLVLLLVTRLPHAQRRDLQSQGQAGVYYIPLVTGQAAAVQDWSGIIHVNVAASTHFVDGSSFNVPRN